MKKQLSLVGALLLLAALIVAAQALAFVPLGSDFRVSNTGTDGDGLGTFTSKVAYNSTANEYLVVWEGDNLVNNEIDIFGQRVSTSGTELGSDFRISNVTDVDAATRDASSAAVAYDSTSNEYLVVWRGDTLADDDNEIFGQRVSAAGAEVGSDFRISNVTDVGAGRDASTPAVAYNSTSNEYLVAWQGDGLPTDNENEIFGQRVSATGTEVGTDFRISSVGADTVTTRIAAHPAVSYSPADNEYFVVWGGDGLATDDEDEVFGQRVSAAGAEAGTNDFRISNVGTDTDANRDASNATIAYNSSANQYLVAWHGDSLATEDEREVFGQLVSATGAEVGSDFRISNTGSDGSTLPTGQRPAAAYSSNSNEYLVTFQADGLATDNEEEIFGQRVSAAGAEIGSDFRISTVGADGDATRDGFDPAVAYNTVANEYLTTWDADGLATNDEEEVFAHRIGIVPTPPSSTPGTTSPVPGADTTIDAQLSVKKKQKGLKQKAVLLEATCPTEACTVVADGSLNVPGASAAKKFKLGKVTKALAAGQKTRFKLKLSKKPLNAIKRALKKHKKVTARVNVTATDGAGNIARQTQSVRVTG